MSELHGSDPQASPNLPDGPSESGGSSPLDAQRRPDQSASPDVSEEPGAGPPVRPRSATEKRALILVLVTLVAALAVRAELAYAIASTVPEDLRSRGEALIPELVGQLFFFPFYTPGCFLLVGLIQLLARRPASAVIALAADTVPLAYSAIVLTAEPYWGGADMTATIVLRVILGVFLVLAAASAAAAGRDGRRAQPARVSLGAGAMVFLLLISLTALLNGGSIMVRTSQVSEFQVALGPWFTVTATMGDASYDGLPFPGEGVVVLLVTLVLSVLALRALARRRRTLFLVSGLGAVGAYLVHHVALWVVAGDALERLAPFWACLLLFVLEAGVLVGMVRAALSPAARDWFVSGPEPGPPGVPQSPLGSHDVAVPGEDGDAAALGNPL